MAALFCCGLVLGLSFRWFSSNPEYRSTGTGVALCSLACLLTGAAFGLW
jgi:hypothetical protein